MGPAASFAICGLVLPSLAAAPRGVCKLAIAEDDGP